MNQTISLKYYVAIFIELLLIISRNNTNGVTSTSPLNINIKSKKRSGLSTNNSSTMQGKHHHNSTKKKTLDTIATPTIDLSGTMTCHVSSPQRINLDDDDSSRHDRYKTTPLFRWGNNTNGFIPDIHLGAIYDFSKVWYGATRFISTFTWYKQNLSKVITYEKDLRSHYDYSAQCTIQSQRWNIFHREKNESKMSSVLRVDDDHISTVSVRWDDRQRSGPSSTISISTPLHPRLKIEAKSTIYLPNNNDNIVNNNHFMSHMQNMEPLNWSEGSWIPDLSITAGGRLSSKSAFLVHDNDTNRHHIRHRTKRYSNKSNSFFHQVGVRFMVSKQLNWNIFGLSSQSGSSNRYYNDYDENETLVRLEFSGLNSKGDVYNSFTVQSYLERVRESIQCKLQHERVQYLTPKK